MWIDSQLPTQSILQLFLERYYSLINVTIEAMTLLWSGSSCCLLLSHFQLSFSSYLHCYFVTYLCFEKDGFQIRINCLHLLVNFHFSTYTIVIRIGFSCIVLGLGSSLDFDISTSRC